jgi:glycosyltransferase involved in cell wall biosynthesis
MYLIFYLFVIYFILFIAFGLIFFALKKHKKYPINVDYTVIIPVKNETENIISCINSILIQSYLPAKILIVDDHSSDNILKVIQNNFSQYGFIKYIKLEDEEYGKKLAIKRGLLASNTEIALITDADCVWHEKFSENFYFDVKKRLISFPVVYLNSSSFISKIFQVELLLLNSVGWGSMLLKKPFLISGAGMILQKNDYLQFCEQVETPTTHGDDMYFLEFIKKKYGNSAIQVNLSPGSLIFTKPPKDLNEYLHQRARWSSKTPYYKNFLSWFWAVLTLIIQLVIPVMLIFNVKFGILLLFIKLLAEIFLYSSAVNFFKLYYNLLACIVFSLFSWLLLILIISRWAYGFEWKKN